MKKKLLAAMMTGCMMISTVTVSAEAVTEPFGDTIKYDPAVEINDGKDITVELWEWGSDELFQQAIDSNSSKCNH